MTEIVISEHVPSDSDLERLNLFAGRHMGEDEFERQQAYVDRRLAHVFSSMMPGIVHGLEVRSVDVQQKAGLAINAGLAVAGNGLTLGLYYPLFETWDTLIDAYLKRSLAANPMGLFYLTLERNTRYVDEDLSIHPDQRTEFDPTRDARRLVVGNLALFRLAIDPDVAAGFTREAVENYIAAMHLDLAFMDAMKVAVPLGLVFIDNLNRGTGNPAAYGVRWFSATCGQYKAELNSGYHLLRNQVREAFIRIQRAAQAQSALSISDYIAANLKLDFLPAAGELPPVLLRNLESRNSAQPPGVAWIPQHLAVDIVPVPEESVPALLEEHIGRRPLDLRQGAGERMRLLLAVNEPDYKPDLLDVPPIDEKLAQDIYRFYMRSFDIWAEWKRQFDVLYFLPADAAIDLDSAAIAAMDLPVNEKHPQFPVDFFAQVVTKARSDLGVESGKPSPYPYDMSPPAEPDFYKKWLARWMARTTDPKDPRTYPDHVNPKAPVGLVIQYTAALVDIDALDNQIRITRSRVERTRDYLLLQRQQLDSQTVSLTALAGGVAGDGSGLQVARWLPFTQLKATKAATTQGVVAEAAASTTPSSTPLFTTSPVNFITLQSSTSIAKTAVNLVAKGAETKLTNNNLVFASALRKSPTIFAPLQFNMNNSRLDKIAEAPRQALTRPAFDAKEFRFGVLEHIRPEVQEYKKAVRGMTELVITARNVFDADEGKQIEAKLKKLGVPLTYEEVQDAINKQPQNDRDELSARLYEELFKAGQILTRQIAMMEARYEQLESKLQGLMRARINKEDEIGKLTALIRIATEQLTALDKRRVEFLGDYGVAQRLLDDDWLDTYKLNEERTRILTKGVRGLYYIRACQTPVGEALADPLLLRYAKARDIVPGCDSDIDPDLPDDLDDFFDTVLEIPMAAWTDLQPFTLHIPMPERLGYMETLRNARLAEKANRQGISILQNASTTVAKPAAATAQMMMAKTAKTLVNTAPQLSVANVSLVGIRQQTQATLGLFAQLAIPFTQVSAKIRQQDAAEVISLADLLATTRGPLQKQAQDLHNRLEQAAWCMLEKLNELAPSLRLEWAQLAEDDRLPVERVELWPSLERAEREDFNSTRTLAEIVAWWFKQLDQDAMAPARSAMRNMVRAILIHASMGDPAEILQGNVQVPPRRFLAGELLRLQLNRAPKPGTLLQLLDTQSRVIALLNVDDHDDKGTVARITQLAQAAQPKLQITTQFRVVASRATNQFAQRRP